MFMGAAEESPPTSSSEDSLFLSNPQTQEEQKGPGWLDVELAVVFWMN